MPMDAGGAKGSLKADINVTPLVDVMLVLLIFMMLLAPLLHHDAVRLPEADNSTDKPDTQNQTVVAIDSHSMFYKGDKDAKYSAIMDAMDALRTGQIENI